MKIKNITDYKKFMEVICDCKGKIELVSSAGDRINLKSTFCQYIALDEIFSDAKIKDIELIIEKPEDELRLIEYIIRG